MISEAAAVLAERRQRQQPRGRALAWMAFSTLVRRAACVPADRTQGIVYGDLGTSPICARRPRRSSLTFADALQGIFAADRGAPAPADVVGAISAIVWSLTIVAAIKYAIVRRPARRSTLTAQISLEFGSSEGEGGCFSLFTTLYAPAPNDDEAATIFDRSDMHGLAVFRTRTRDDVEVEERIPPAMQKLRVLARSGVKWSLRASAQSHPI